MMSGSAGKVYARLCDFMLRDVSIAVLFHLLSILIVFPFASITMQCGPLVLILVDSICFCTCGKSYKT